MRALFHPFWLVNEEPVYHRSALVLLQHTKETESERECRTKGQICRHVSIARWYASHEGIINQIFMSRPSVILQELHLWFAKSLHAWANHKVQSCIHFISCFASQAPRKIERRLQMKGAWRSISEIIPCITNHFPNRKWMKITKTRLMEVVWDWKWYHILPFSALTFSFDFCLFYAGSKLGKVYRFLIFGMLQNLRLETSMIRWVLPSQR